MNSDLENPQEDQCKLLFLKFLRCLSSLNLPRPNFTSV